MKVLIVILGLAALSQAAPAQEKFIACDLCQTLVGMAREYAHENYEQIQERLYGVCSRFGFFEYVCKGLVDEYMPRIMQYVQDSTLTNDAICELIRLCDDQRVNLLVAYQKEEALKPKFSVVCDLCSTLVGMARQYAGENQQQIQQRLYRVCDRFGFISGICKGLVDEYLPRIMQYVGDSTLSDEDICSRIDLCNDRRVKLLMSVMPASNRGIGCSICTGVVDFAKDFANLSQPALKQMIYDKVCDRFGFLSGLCEGLVDEYLPRMYQYLNSDETPRAICEYVGLCD